MEADNVLFIVLTVVSSVSRGGMVVFGLSSWLGKVWANRILESDRRRYSEEIDRLRPELERRFTCTAYNSKRNLPAFLRFGGK